MNETMTTRKISAEEAAEALRGCITVDYGMDKAQEFAQACDVIGKGIDYIKMQQRESIEQDKEILDKCAYALDLLTNISKMYENLEHNGGKKKKDRDR